MSFRSRVLPVGLTSSLLPSQPRPHPVDLGGGDVTEQWLFSIGAACLRRKVIAAQTSLFLNDQPAHAVYLVIDGELVVSRQHRAGLKSVVRFLRPGDVFVYDCDGRHFAHCSSTVDSVVVAIDRGWIVEARRSNLAVARLMRAVHGSELSMLLESLDAEPRRGRLADPTAEIAIGSRKTA